MAGRRILWIVAEDWFFVLHYLALAQAFVARGDEVHMAARVGQRGDKARGTIEAAGITVHPLERLQRTGLNPLSDFAAEAEMLALCQSLRPDLVQTVALKPVLYGISAAKRARVPSRVALMPGLGFVFTGEGFKARILRPIVSWLLRRAIGDDETQVMALNADDRDALSRLCGRLSDDIEVMAGTGVDLEQYAPSPEPEGPVVASFVGRVLREKGVPELVEAARILKQRGSDVVVRIVGAPDTDNPTVVTEVELRQWVEEGLIRWEGPTDDVPAVWRESHIAVLPSHREGLGMSLIEAAAAGRPAVTTDVPGCRQAVRDGETGLLVPRDSPMRLADALQQLADDPALRARMGAAARARAEADFGFPSVRDQLVRIYRRLCSDIFGANDRSTAM